MSIGEKLDQSRGIARGFDFMRVVLAFLVVAAHSIWIVDMQSQLGLTRVSWFPFYAILPAFFGLSGFLVAGSAERLTARDYVINRALRMMPALGVEIVLSAFILGVIFTTLPLQVYFSEPGTWRYLTNIFGMVDYYLPGVFLDLPAKGIVNKSIWTIPWEYVIYTLVVIMMITGAMKKSYPILLVVGAYVVAVVVTQAFHLQYGPSLGSEIVRWLLYKGDGARLLLPGLLGIVAYKLRYRLPYSWAGAAVALVWCLLVAAFAPLRWIYDPAMAVLASAPLVYLTLVLGVTELPKLPFFHRGDYSYGIYLYGWPIQQALKTMMPWIVEPWLLTAIAFPIITVFAVFSWHCIEKPCVRLRKNFSFVAQLRLRPDDQQAVDAARERSAPGRAPAAADLKSSIPGSVNP